MNENIGILPASVILGNDRFVIWDCFSDANSTYNQKLHFHDFYELSMIYEGESDFLINGERVSLKAGTIHFVTPSDYHMQLTREGQHIRYYNLIFKPDLLDDDIIDAIDNCRKPISFTPSETQLTDLFSLAQKLLAEYQAPFADRPAAFSEHIIQNGIETACILILRALSEQSRPDTDRLLPIRRALAYIRRNYRTPLSLQQVANSVFLSPSYFSQLFHKTMGISFSNYLTDYRLQIAARYLQSGDLPLKEIASLSGFPTFPYFSAAFKKRYGISPSNYRNRIQDNESDDQ